MNLEKEILTLRGRIDDLQYEIISLTFPCAYMCDAFTGLSLSMHYIQLGECRTKPTDSEPLTKTTEPRKTSPAACSSKPSSLVHQTEAPAQSATIAQTQNTTRKSVKKGPGSWTPSNVISPK
jgi:hypothetical protein